MEKDWVGGGIIGLVTGDALGVPVEFSDRQTRKQFPVTDMMGHCGPHRQPKGTWSDDSSLMLASMDSLIEKGFDLPDMMDRFASWLREEGYTAHGDVFDVGGTCSSAILRWSREEVPERCGGRHERDNGNGSLMRILPVSLYALDRFWDDEEEMITAVHRASALTHAHPISMMACGIYTRIAEGILEMHRSGGTDLVRALQNAMDAAQFDYRDLERGDLFGDYNLRRCWDTYYSRMSDIKAFSALPEEQIKSGGFSVHTLEASVWCLLNTDSYPDCVLRAVNLGGDTDTTGAVAGGLAGLLYGLDAIPESWRECLARKSWLDELTEKFKRVLSDG